MSLSAEDREILADFIHESKEGLEETESLLLQLEEMLAGGKSIDKKVIDSIFRTIHSIKGSAGFLGLELTNALTHQAESILDDIRKDRLTLTKRYIDLFLEVCDRLQVIFDHLNEHFSEEGLEDLVTSTLKDLEAVQYGEAEKSEETHTESTDVEEVLIDEDAVKQFVNETYDILNQLEEELMVLEKDPENQERLHSIFRLLHTIKGNAGLLNYTDINAVTHQAETVFEFARNGHLKLRSQQVSLILKMIDFIRSAVDAAAEGKPPVIPGKLALIDLLGEILPGPAVSSTEEKPEEKTDENNNGPEKSPGTKKKKKVDEVIRVDVEKLNRLMDLVGEIVIAEAMVSNHPELAGLELEGFEKAINYLQKNIRELQDLATAMRMIPLSGLFGKMKRLVRDISMRKHRKVELVISGGETEVDRSVIEHISDPLVHIIRNAIDHGIEDEKERVSAGKPPHGTISIDAKRVGGEIWIVVQDDGRGLDQEKILKRAIERGIVNENEESLSEEKIYQLIFQPGFSTAEKVTQISGRGVGMDVVKKNVEKIRGHIDIDSSPGKGTSIFLKIPLTTAIIDGMLMRVEDSIYAIPTLDIKESLQVTPEQTVDLMDGQEVVRVRDQLIPILRLQELHQMHGEDSKALHEGIIVVTESAGKPVGFLVDEIIGQQQLVIKPLPRYIGKLEGVSGCAVLGNGDICLILDMATLVKIAEASFVE